MKSKRIFTLMLALVMTLSLAACGGSKQEEAPADNAGNGEAAGDTQDFGGTHLVPPDPERIARTADYFRHSSITCAGVCHCTGPMGLEVFAQTVPAYLPTGAGLVWQTPSFARTSAGRKES